MWLWSVLRSWVYDNVVGSSCTPPYIVFYAMIDVHTKSVLEGFGLKRAIKTAIHLYQMGQVKPKAAFLCVRVSFTAYVVHDKSYLGRSKKTSFYTPDESRET